MIKKLFGGTKNAVITFVSALLIILVIFFSKQVGQVELAVGDVSSEDIYAPRVIIDTVTTEEKREEARLGVTDIYVQDNEKAANCVKNVESFFDMAHAIRSQQFENSAAAALQLKNTATVNISEDTAKAIVSASPSQFAQLRTLSSILKSVMNDGVIDKNDGTQLCVEEISELSVSDKLIDAAEEIISLTIIENKVFDEESTLEKREQAASSVADVEYKKGQVIVTQGSVVTKAQYTMLSDLGLLKGSSPITSTYAFGVMLFIIISLLILLFSASTYKSKSSSASSVTAVTALIVILMTFYGSKYIPERLNPLLPVGIFPGIVTIFASPQLAIISNLLLSVFNALAFDANWGYTISLILAGTMSVFCFATVKRRAHLLPSAIVAALFYGLSFTGMSLIESNSAVTAISAFFKGFGGGMLSGLITIGSLPFFEWLFNATTPMKLSELANPENKLLKKLLVEAPGTYHHSLTVANIAEIAARSIKADSLLARVGAYYHDVGKLRHPLYFKENQYDKNAHDNLAPEDSSAIIISHVTDGSEIAAKNHLPKSICDIIAQHHGKTTTGYFLIRARELGGDVDESKFTYPGPVPQTKEAAIVMLADSCEAAVRSIDEKSEAKIEAMVRKIATDRVNTGQFSECNMTFAELEKVIKVITKTLGGYFHERIKYE